MSWHTNATTYCFYCFIKRFVLLYSAGGEMQRTQPSVAVTVTEHFWVLRFVSRMCSNGSDGNLGSKLWNNIFFFPGQDAQYPFFLYFVCNTNVLVQFSKITIFCCFFVHIKQLFFFLFLKGTFQQQNVNTHTHNDFYFWSAYKKERGSVTQQKKKKPEKKNKRQNLEKRGTTVITTAVPFQYEDNSCFI